MSNTVSKVGVEFVVFNKMNAGVQSVARDMGRLQSGMTSLARSAAALGVAGLGIAAAYKSWNFMKDSTRLAMAQQDAEEGLTASLARTGDATVANLAAFKQYARELQALTRYGDERILAEMEYAHNVGISTDQLDEATVAAIGLSAAYRKDLGASMRLVALAAKGETGQLKEMGIVIDKNLSPQAKYNELIRQGTEAFRLEYEHTKTARGQYEQTMNVWGDTKEKIGNELLPAMQTLFSSLNKWLTANQGDVQTWASNVVSSFGWVASQALKWQDTIVGENADVLIHREALQREAIERGVVDHGQTAVEQTLDAWARKNPTIMNDPRLGAYLDADARAQWRQRQTSETNWIRVREIEAQLRKENEDMLHPRAPQPAPLGGTYEMPTLDVTSNQPGTVPGGPGGGAVTKRVMDTTAAYRRMAQDMERTDRRSWEIRRDLLAEEYRDYVETMDDKKLALDWFHEQQIKLSIEEAKASQNVFAGFGAGILEMQRELQTLGELGADSAKMMRDAWVSGTWDMIAEGRKLSDVIRSIGMDFAKMAYTNSMNRLVTGLMGWGVAALRGGGGYIDPASGINTVTGLKKRAAGGDVWPGQVYWTGEHGPEPFISGTPGRIVSNREARQVLGDAAGGGSSQEVESLLRQLLIVTERNQQPIYIIDRGDGVKRELKRMHERRSVYVRG